MNGFQRRKETKKENIRQAAFELFSAYGVQKVSVAQIAEKANVSQVTIYNYFNSKDELILKVISAFLDKRLKEDTEVIESTLPFHEKVDIFVSQKTGELSGLDSDFLKTMMSEDPYIRKIAEDFTKNQFIPLMMRLVEKGKEEGYINHSISNEAILLYIQMFREGKHSNIYPNLEQSKDLFKELVSLFFYGLLGGNLNRPE